MAIAWKTASLLADLAASRVRHRIRDIKSMQNSNPK